MASAAAACGDVALESLTSLDRDVLDRERAVFEQEFDRTVPTFVSWMVHPYGISSFLAVCGVSFWLAVYAESADSRTNVLRGFYFAMLVCIITMACQLRDSLLVRPHPVFWRVVKALAFLYCFGLVWLLFQNVDDARRWLAFWDPSLGVPLVEQSYAAACDLYTPLDPVSSFRNVSDAIWDVFMLSHLIGWFCKMLLIRDLRVTLAASVLFELYEITFTHMLPNFKECWWDTILLDVVLANGLGIVAGYYFLRFFQCTEYNLLGMHEGRWKPLVSFRYFMGPLVVLGSLAAIELNAFFLKFILWVPPPHHLNFWRVVFWWLVGCAGTREWYHWMERPGAPLGVMISLIFVNAGLETIICFKFGSGMFPEPMPPTIKYVWYAVAAGMVLFAATWFPYQHFRNAAAKSGAPGGVSGASSEAEGAPKKSKKSD